MVANLMQRYNPVYRLVTKLMELRPLGELLHGFFENYASDEGMQPDHCSGIDREAAASSSSTGFTSSTCSPAGSVPDRWLRLKGPFDQDPTTSRNR